MTEYEELDAQLRRWLTEDELWAREASRFDADPIREGYTIPELPSGMHWTWVHGEDWAPFAPDPSVSPTLNAVPEAGEYHHVTLVSVETWTWDHGNGLVWHMPQRIIGDSDAVPTAAAGHIIRHDPARVLADIAGKVALLDHVAGWQHEYVDGDTWFSCSQAINPHDADEAPGSGCADEKRKGKPCDCGLDARRIAVLRCVAAGYAEWPEFRPEWRLAC